MARMLPGVVVTVKSPVVVMVKVRLKVLLAACPSLADTVMVTVPWALAAG